MTILKIMISGDGSSTIYNEELNETYHSIHGAINESMHVFINHGLALYHQKGRIIKVLEVGMGTGLNILLTLQQTFHCDIKVLYHTLEPYPLPENIINELNYEVLLNDPFLSGSLRKIHSVDCGKEVILSDNFSLFKHLQELELFDGHQNFDLVYFDAFAPSKQAAIWEIRNFEKLFRMLNFGGSIVSYSANGQFKRNLKAAGFFVQSLKGPPGKREMTIATKPE